MVMQAAYPNHYLGTQAIVLFLYLGTQAMFLINIYVASLGSYLSESWGNQAKWILKQTIPKQENHKTQGPICPPQN